jgi:uncharacterized membrane protein YphA (DoxX/SURF4 family)
LFESIFIYFPGTTMLGSRGKRASLTEPFEYNTINSSTITAATQLSGRVLMSVIFLTAGVSKIGAYAGTQGYMESMGVPGGMLPLVIALEVGAGFAVLLG